MNESVTFLFMSAALQARTHLKISKKSIEKANLGQKYLCGGEEAKKKISKTLWAHKCVVVCLSMEIHEYIPQQTNKKEK